MIQTNCVVKPNPDHMIEEIVSSIRARDAVKVRLVLDYLSDVDRTTQNRLVYELSRADAEFSILMLSHLVTRYPRLCESLPIIRETLVSQLIGHPALIVSNLTSGAVIDKTVVIQTAGELRMGEAIPALLAILRQTDDRETTNLVIDALGRIGGDRVMSTLVEFLYSADRDFTIQAIMALQQVGTRHARTRLAQRMGTDNDLDLIILSALVTAPDDVAISTLNDALRSPNTRTRVFAKEELEKIGEQAIPILIENLKESDPDLVIHTLNVLGTIGDSLAVAPIRRLLSREPRDANIRFAAYETLALLPLSKGAYALAAGLTDKEDHVCIAAARAIDRNLSDVLVTGIKNLIRKEDAEARHIVNTIVNAQADNLFLALAAEDFFQRLAAAYLPHVHHDVQAHYLCLLRHHSHAAFAQRVAGGQPENAARGRVKICAVDDSRVVLSIYKAMLHELGFEPVLFEFPSSALQWLEQEKPALVLTDLNMPRISGLELARKIRARYSQSELPIIMVTTQSDLRDAGAIKAAGINEILGKPFDADTLRTAMGRYIPVG